jgi:hypothetical protein
MQADLLPEANRCPKQTQPNIPGGCVDAACCQWLPLFVPELLPVLLV